jgi:hypothetical protein
MTRAEAAKRHIEDPGAIEHSDAQSKGVFIFLGALAVTIVVSLAVVFGLFLFFSERRETPQQFPLAKKNQVPPEPRLETAPGVELHGLRAQEDGILNSYGWVDRNAGVVRIPIERAMALVAERGLPTRQGQEPGNKP